MLENSIPDHAGQGRHHAYDPTWVVPGVIASGSITSVIGRPGECKSFLCNYTAVQADRGLGSGVPVELLGMTILPSIVFLIDEDSPSNALRHRLHRMNPDHTIEVHSMSGFRLDNRHRRRSLMQEYINVPPTVPVLLVFDSLQRILPGVNLDSAAQASSAMGYLQELRDCRLNTTLLVIHHASSKKPLDISDTDLCAKALGSTHIISASDSLLFVSQVPVADETIFLMKPRARRFKLVEETIAARLVDNLETDGLIVERLYDDLTMPSRAERLLFKLFPKQHVGLTVKEIHDGTGEALSRDVIRVGLHQLAGRGALLETVRPEDKKSHQITYSRNPGFDPAGSFYGRHLVELSNTRREEGNPTIGRMGRGR